MVEVRRRPVGACTKTHFMFVDRSLSLRIISRDQLLIQRRPQYRGYGVVKMLMKGRDLGRQDRSSVGDIFAEHRSMFHEATHGEI